MSRPIEQTEHGRREATPEEFKALSHALRLRILRLCLHEALTNKQIADRLELDPATVLHHVRTLVRTGFLAPEAVRSGNRGALEKPYRATGKSWVLELPRNIADDERVSSRLAVLDALRSELAEAPVDDVRFSRLGLKLTPEAAAELQKRLDDLVEELASRPDDLDGEHYGFYFTLHRQPPAV